MRRPCPPDLYRRPTRFTRRGFMQIGGVSVVGLMASHALMPRFAGAAPAPKRRLVILEMDGGNDGLNTVIPYGDGAYYDLRRRLGIPARDVLRLDATWGLHPALANIKARFDAQQVAVFRGVGHPHPDLSHFFMMDIWWAGDLLGTSHTDSTGWLGRLLDLIADPAAPLVALSLASGTSPALFSPKARVGAAASAAEGDFGFPSDFDPTLRDALRAMTAGDSASAQLLAARRGLQGTFALSDFLGRLTDDVVPGYPDSETARLLSLAAKALAASESVKVIHVPLPLGFDSHTGQLPAHRANLAELDGAVGAFLADLESKNLADDTLVMTTSEFGRRASDNGSDGTDHGTANSHFLIGKGVRGGWYFDPPSLRNLDDDGNLIATASLLDYQATVVEGWMEAPASEVVPGGRATPAFR